MIQIFVIEIRRIFRNYLKLELALLGEKCPKMLFPKYFKLKLLVLSGISKDLE
jgi:hypothetical protein